MEFQTIIVMLIVAAAAAYGLWQIVKKLKSANGSGSCETGCGKCKSE